MIKPMPCYGQMRLYCDLDGVFADFDRRYQDLFGRPRSRHTGWDDIRSVPHFFRDMQMKPDALKLWRFVEPYRPIILTGTPMSVNMAGNEKIEWVANRLGPDVPVICCKSRRKALYCRPGDILVDDTEEYAQLWRDAGGIWITHRTAEDTIEQLKTRGFV